MIKEDYVSFETAKLLKEKGFDWEVHRSYLVNDNVFIPGDINDVPLRKDAIRIPTLQMTTKWLRENHNIQIVVSPYNTLNKTWSYYMFKNFEPLTQRFYIFKTYEEAYEAAIKYCLENLI